mmetsp:Transcript_29969/g.53171  ORF Transcript_29969/g.53171 Transcript_29969/m.53171 type:complete len:128 (+) Transcript_29969:98-481(+)
MGLISVESPADFEAKFAEVKEQETVIAIFKGSTDPSTGVSWCDDCERADPFVHAALLKVTTDRPVLVCDVGLRDDWKGRPEHIYRNHPSTRLSGVPTVIRYQFGHEVARLVEGQLLNQAIVDEVIAS